MAYSDKSVSMAIFDRMPVYLKILRELKIQGQEFVSSVALAEAASSNPSVVKSDLSFAIVNKGKPKVGYSIDELINDIEKFLDYCNVKDAIIVGVGKLGQALMGYKGFEDYGLNIIAGFDTNEKIVNQTINGKKVFSIEKIESIVNKLNIKIAILTIPQTYAQEMADTLIKNGIRAIWNFTPAHLIVPDNVALRNENMAVSLAVLSQQLKVIIQKEKK